MNAIFTIGREHGSGARETGARRAGISHPMSVFYVRSCSRSNSINRFNNGCPFNDL